MTSGSNRLQLSVTNSSIAVAGEIDAESAPQLEAAIDQFGASDKVRLDVAGVTFIDSSALRVLVAQHHRLDGAGGRLEIVNPSKSVVRLFEITSLDQTFHVTSG
jgi:anti-anti-sigma factor